MISIDCLSDRRVRGRTSGRSVVGIIMDVEASHAIRQAEVGATQTMIERTEERFKAERLAADTAYGCTPEGGIAPKLTC